MLDDPQRMQLDMLVFHLVGTQPDVHLLVGLVGAEAVKDMPAFDKPFHLAHWLVGTALRAPTAAVLVSLIENADAAGIAPDLQDLAGRLRADPSLWTRTLQDPLVVAKGDPFVDRATVRDLLRTLVTDPDGPACLVVRGDDGEGKTTVGAWLEKLAFQQDGVAIGRYEVRGACAEALTPRDLVSRLAAHLGLPLHRFPRDHEDPHRWAQNAAAWLVRQVQEKGGRHVVVLDEFDHPRLPPCLHTCVLDVAERLGREAPLRASLRLVLLGYDEERLRDRQIPYERRVLEFVDEGMVRDWFSRRFPDQEAFMYEDAAAEVMERLPAAGPGRMEALCNAVLLVSAGFRT